MVSLNKFCTCAGFLLVPCFRFTISLMTGVLLFASNSHSQPGNDRTPKPETLFALYEVAAGYDISPDEITDAIKEINETGISLSEFRQLEKTGSSIELAVSSVILGWQSVFDAEFTSAVSYFEINVRVRQELDMNEQLAYGYLYLGFARYQNLNYEEALMDFIESERLARKYGLISLAPISSALAGQTHMVSNKYDEAELWFNKAHLQFDELGTSRGRAMMLNELAELDIRRMKYDDADEKLEKALLIFRSAGDSSGQAIVVRNQGLIYLKNGMYDSAMNSFQESLILYPEISVAILLKNTYLKLYTLASLMQDHKLSNEYNIKYVELRDSIDNVQKMQMQSSLKTRKDLLVRDRINDVLQSFSSAHYEGLSIQELEQNKLATEEEIIQLEQEKIIEDLNTAKRASDQLSIEREERIEELKREKALQEAALSKKELQLSRQQAVRNSLLLIALSALIIALLLYNRFRQQKKSHNELDMAYNELSKTHTQLVTTQEQLIHSQKMASLGQMTAGVAHEIQNPLNFVNNFSDLTIEIVKEMKSGELTPEEAVPQIITNIEKIHEHGNRADKIVKGMLMHSRSGTNEKQIANINDIIDELVSLSYHGSKKEVLKTDVDIRLELDDDLPEIPVLVGEISRVLVNLFNNSFYSLGQKYDETATGEFNPVLTVSTSSAPDHIEIRVHDNGTGIPESIRNKIFDPFYTTKPPGEGTGLGLSLSYDIITKGHNGSMILESEEGKYCNFIIRLPVSEGGMTK